MLVSPQTKGSSLLNRLQTEQQNCVATANTNEKADRRQGFRHVAQSLLVKL